MHSQIIIDTKHFCKGYKYFCLGTQITSACCAYTIVLLSFRSKYNFESLVKSLNATADDRLGGNIATIHTSLSTNIHLMHQIMSTTPTTNPYKQIEMHKSQTPRHNMQAFQ